MVNYLLLDVDGVLQFEAENTEERLQQSYHWITSPADFRKDLFTNREFDSVLTGTTDFHTIVDKILPGHVHDLGALEYMDSWLNENIVFNQTLIDQIPELPTTCLATNQDRCRGEYIESLYAPHVEGSFISAMIGLSKPSAEYFQHILHSLQATAEDCVFVDDSEANVKAAETIGINGIVFKDNESLFAELNDVTLNTICVRQCGLCGH